MLCIEYVINSRGKNLYINTVSKLVCYIAKFLFYSIQRVCYLDDDS